MAINDRDYQQFPYTFGVEPGYQTDMTDPIRWAVRLTVSELVGQKFDLLEIGV